MKKIAFIFNLLIISQLAISQGIIWEPTIDGAFQKAKAAKKNVFVECYHPNCPICMSLEPTFKTKELGDYYNKNFVNYKLNLSDPKHVKFLNDKNIHLPGFPLFTYFDENRNLIHLVDEGKDAPAKAMIAKAKIAVDYAQNAAGYKKRYENGERNLDFLISYAYFSRITTDTTMAYKLGDEIFNVYPKDQLSEMMSWVITQKVIMDVDNGFAQYWFNHLDVAKKYAGNEHPDAEKSAMGSIIQYSLYSKHGMVYSSAQVAKIKEYMGKVGAAQHADGFTWQHEARAYLREGKTEKALGIIDKIAKQNVASGMSLVYLVSICNDFANDEKYLSAAKGWLATAKPLLKESKDLAEMNYQTARMYQKVGDKGAAQKAAIEAKNLAVSAKTTANDMKRFDDLVGSLK
jgi:hypothetical protein